MGAEGDSGVGGGGGVRAREIGERVNKVGWGGGF